MFWLYFAVYLLACMAAGASGAIFPPGDWYKGLTKPSWNPPDWVFPLAWMTLYVCMAAAAARVALLPGSGIALGLWSVQIALNTLWTPVFFGLQKMRVALYVVGCLWVSVAACLVALWQVDTIAGLLFVPYLLWVTIASALNRAMVRLNPQAA